MDQGEATEKHKPWCGIHHNQAGTTTCDCDNRAAMAAYAFGKAASEVKLIMAQDALQRAEARAQAADARAAEAEERVAVVVKLLKKSYKHTLKLIEVFE